MPVGRHEDGRAGGNHGLEPLRERAPRRPVHTGKRLIKQQQSGLTHARPREQHPPQLPVGQLPEPARRERGHAERTQGTVCRDSIGGGRWIVQAYARVPARLHDRAGRELLGMIGLQVRGDEPHALLEGL